MDAINYPDLNEDINKYTIHQYIVNHNINYNFSLILKSMLEGLIEPIVKKTIEFREVTENSITFAFEAPI